jgi:hypothetical protein
MDKKIIKGLIDEKLEVIQEQFSIIRDYEAKIPVIELDLLMASIRDLYELVLNLQVENTGGVILKPAQEPEEPKVMKPQPIPAVPEPVEEELTAEKPVISVRLSSGIISMERVVEEKPEPETIPVSTSIPIAEPIPELIPEPIPEPVPEPIPEPEPLPIPEPEPEEEHGPYQESSTRITFDLFSENAGNTLADRLKEGQERRVADKLQDNKIIDLRNTIGINDKFLFINELFEGNMRIYDEAIQKLNTSTTIAQTDLLLLDLKIVYNWDSESPTVKKFVELVRRKF